MPDKTHLLIALAASHAPGCRQAMAGLQLPQLERLLARLTPEEADVGLETDFSPPHERALARALGLPAAADGSTPWAAWQQRAARAGAGELPAPDGAAPGLPARDEDAPSLPAPDEEAPGLPAPDGAWGFITPCHWHIGADRVLMTDPDELRLDAPESRALRDILAPWFAQDGITLYHDQPTRWLARGEPLRNQRCASLARVIGRDVRAWLPPVADARLLHRLQSEVQMLLYTHPFNDARASRGLPTINAFWLHGAGALPVCARPATGGRAADLSADDRTADPAMGRAGRHGAEHQPDHVAHHTTRSAGHAARWAAGHATGRPKTPPTGHHAAGQPSDPAAALSQTPQMPQTLLHAALREDWAAWANAWRALDAGPIAQLAAQAARGAPVRLTLCGERSAQTFHAAPRGLWQRVQGVFQRPRLTSLLEQL